MKGVPGVAQNLTEWLVERYTAVRTGQSDILEVHEERR
jgi:hypothetical protein